MTEATHPVECQTVTFMQEHLAYLKALKPAAQGPVGYKPSSLREYIPDAQAVDVPDQTLSRRELSSFCREVREPAAAFIACMAWGGMNRMHGRRAFEWIGPISAIIERLRQGELGRIEAYRAFQSANIGGLKPAYYTKLIFFCTTHDGQPGYIMDKWTSLSVNLLSGRDLVALSPTEWVLPTNSPEVYECFCRAVEQLGGELDGISGAEAEERIFSVGRGKGEWRKYLKTHLRKRSS